MQSRRNAFRYLYEAYRAFRKKNFTKAIIILERVKDSGHEDHYTLFLHSLCLLYSNNFSAVHPAMEKIERISPLYTPFIQLKAFLALKSSTSREGAIQAYISALEKKSSDRLLRSGLKQVENAKDFYKYQKEARLTDLVYVPKPGDRDKPGNLHQLKDRVLIRPAWRQAFRPLKIILLVSLAVLSVTVAVIFITWGRDYSFYHDKNAVKLDRESQNRIDMVDVSGPAYGLINRISQEKTPEFYASGEALLRDFSEARVLVKKGFFNKALLILNKITNSNASYPVKEKSDFLVRFIMDSPERLYEEIRLNDINAKPWLYRGSAVRLTGKAVNVRENRNGTSFSVMIGFDGKNFSGICDVFNPATGIVSNGNTVEIMGIYIMSVGSRSAPYVSAEKVRVISPESR